MGYLLKQALKTLCGVNRWSYAVFWKIGCQNPKLLIWEECYYEPQVSSCGIQQVESSKLAFNNWGACWASDEVLNSRPVQAGEGVQPLVNKMMMENQFKVVGEGLAGRAAVTGHHQWILSQGNSREAYPLEVLKELSQQFSAGIETIAVIPVLPHGVVQLGSYKVVMENMVFVNNVRMTICQLGCIPGVLLSGEDAMREPAQNIGVPIHVGNSISEDFVGRSKVLDSVPIAYRNSETNLVLSEMHVGQTSSSFVRQNTGDLCSSDATFGDTRNSQSFVEYHDDHCQSKARPLMKPNFSPKDQLVYEVTKAEVLPSNPNAWSNQQAYFYVPGPPFDQQSPFESMTVDSGSLRLTKEEMLSNASVSFHTKNNSSISNGYAISQPRRDADLVPDHIENSVLPSVGVNQLCNGVEMHLKSSPVLDSLSDACGPPRKNIGCTQSAASAFPNVESSKQEASSSSGAVNHLLATHTSDNKSVEFQLDGIRGMEENDLFQALGIIMPQHNENLSSPKCIPDFSYDVKHEYGVQTALLDDEHDNTFFQDHSGDDLFDILGADFKNKLLNGNWNDFQSSGQDTITMDMSKNPSTSMISKDASSTVNQGKSDTGIVPMSSVDHLLDSLASSPPAKKSLDDNVSCWTTLTNMSSSSGPSASCSYGQVSMPIEIHGGLVGFPRSLTDSAIMGSCSFGSESSKETAGVFLHSSSIYGSQISSWMEQGHDMKKSTSVSTAQSKKHDETSKTSRKRLKPGENPRPRPKDRQMIQDRLKELREIVPNGAKCSIDSLLERAIKHMLFLQSIAKHADKLKQIGELKIISTEGGLCLKDNFDGGATWAYEVGSQSMVCPIIIEDLNEPRQMLVKMLCEERGLFLEIADVIRGLGLTILIGVIETRNEKIWARFAVEANRDVTRMEIFVSLVRLLEQTTTNGAEPSNANELESVKDHQFNHGAPIPTTTGQARMLQ
nr:transcription factor LHW-like [Ipomoea batatas]